MQPLIEGLNRCSRTHRTDLGSGLKIGQPSLTHFSISEVRKRTARPNLTGVGLAPESTRRLKWRGLIASISAVSLKLSKAGVRTAEVGSAMKSATSDRFLPFGICCSKSGAAWLSYRLINPNGGRRFIAMGRNCLRCPPRLNRLEVGRESSIFNIYGETHSKSVPRRVFPLQFRRYRIPSPLAAGLP